jgi:large subunit ribosomal protein L25
VTADATALPEHLELDIAGKRAGESLSAGDVRLPSGTELAQDAEHVIVAFLGVQSEEQLEADLAASEEELGAGAAGAAAAGDDVDADGSESEATGEGDLVGETDAPRSETPAQAGA